MGVRWWGSAKDAIPKGIVASGEWRVMAEADRNGGLNRSEEDPPLQRRGERRGAGATALHRRGRRGRGKPTSLLGTETSERALRFRSGNGRVGDEPNIPEGSRLVTILNSIVLCFTD